MNLPTSVAERIKVSVLHPGVSQMSLRFTAYLAEQYVATIVSVAERAKLESHKYVTCERVAKDKILRLPRTSRILRYLLRFGQRLLGVLVFSWFWHGERKRRDPTRLWDGSIS